MNSTLVIILCLSIVFVMSIIGSALVFVLKKDIGDKTNSIFLGFTAGIMVAASVWSLIEPAFEYSGHYGKWSFLVIVAGVVLGSLFIVLLDKLVPHIHRTTNKTHGVNSSLKKSTKFLLAMAIHNIPEGLAVGFSLGAAIATSNSSLMVAALALSFAIGIHNMPEGAAISLLLYKDTGNKKKSFLYGVISALFEPLSAIVGLVLAMQIQSIMSWLLAFAAGAMMFVVVEDLIPDSKLESSPKLGAWSFMFGFLLMIVIDALV